MTTAVADHVVAKVLESRSYNGKYGPMKAYDLLFESGDIAEISQKPSTPAPQIGDALHGQIREEYGRMKFKKITPGFEDKDARPATSSMGSAPLRRNVGGDGSITEVAPPLPERAPSEWVSHPVGPGVPDRPTNLAIQMNGDHRQWSIVRQHSQAMAIDWIRGMMFIGAVTKEQASVTLVRRITDWFQADAEGKNPPDYTP